MPAVVVAASASHVQTSESVKESSIVSAAERIKEEGKAIFVAATTSTPGYDAEVKRAADAIRQKVCCEMGADLLALFEAWDQDGDGCVSKTEFADGVITAGLTDVRDEAVAVFDSFDVGRRDRSRELTLTDLKIQIDLGRQALGAKGSIGSNGIASTLSLAQNEVSTLSMCARSSATLASYCRSCFFLCAASISPWASRSTICRGS
jgi:hypothetical protein